jgi:hypothetical protein
MARRPAAPSCQIRSSPEFGAARVLDPLDEPEWPQLEQRGASRQRLADLLQQKDLGRAEEQEATSPAAVGEELDRVEKRRLLLDLIENHEARAMVQPAHRVAREPQAFVWIVEGEVHRRRIAGGGKQVADERRLACLASPGEDGDGPAREPRPEQVKEATRVERRVSHAFRRAARFQGDFA